MTETARAHVIISGRVQGVFFRMETQRAADARGVDGWVKNRPEGTVEAVFEGEKPRVETMIDWCWKGSPHSKVDNVKVTWETYTGDYSGFNVNY